MYNSSIFYNVMLNIKIEKRKKKTPEKPMVNISTTLTITTKLNSMDCMCHESINIITIYSRELENY